MKGEEYKIDKISEVGDYKLRIKITLYISILLTPIIMYLFGSALIKDVIPFIDTIFTKVKLALLIFGLICWAIMMYTLDKESKYYSCWKILDSIGTYIFVEQNEGETIHNILKARDNI